MSVSEMKVHLAPQTGAALTLHAGQKLEIIDPTGGQVADVAIFTAADIRERFSPGRTIDYNEKIALSTGSALYSNRSQVLMRFLEDDVAVHDVLLSPCSERMFEILRGHRAHPSCHGNLASALLRFGIHPDDIESTLNVFMNVSVDAMGAISIKPPTSRAGDRLVLQAQIDLIIGITACSSEYTNGGTCKSIEYRVDGIQDNTDLLH